MHSRTARPRRPAPHRRGARHTAWSAARAPGMRCPALPPGVSGLPDAPPAAGPRPAEGPYYDEREAAVAEELYATLHTTEGDIVVRLFPDHAPKTVRNFVELAEGSKEWVDPRDGQRTT